MEVQMTTTNAARAGITLAITVGIGYSACALVFWIWPEVAATFMNRLFHGLDFRKLQSGATLFRFDDFAYALAGLMIWAFIFGTIYGWLQTRFGKQT